MARPSAVSEVELHPLVLLSVVDHYYRVVRAGGARRQRNMHLFFLSLSLEND